MFSYCQLLLLPCHYHCTVSTLPTDILLRTAHFRVSPPEDVSRQNATCSLNEAVSALFGTHCLNSLFLLIRNPKNLSQVLTTIVVEKSNVIQPHSPWLESFTKPMNLSICVLTQKSHLTPEENELATKELTSAPHSIFTKQNRFFFF